MIIQATPYGTKKEEPFAFTYSGSFVDERDSNGIGDVTLNTSGQLVTSGKTVRVTVYILAGGGGAAASSYSNGRRASGGGGGNQTVMVELTPGTYDIVIGMGGAKKQDLKPTAGSGGNTTAFGYTSTGGGGASAYKDSSGTKAGTGGTPNGGAGSTSSSSSATLPGGTPNGGAVTSGTPQKGGNGLVRITFS